MKVKLSKMLAILSAGLVLGAGLGLTLANIHKTESNQDNSNFCQEVEKDIQEEMETGFVNCFEPSGGYFGLREDIKNSTSISCICRKKINGIVQQIKIAQPN